MEALENLIKERDSLGVSLDQGMREIERVRQEGNLPQAWDLEVDWERKYNRFLLVLDMIARMTGEPVERSWPVAA